MPSTLPVTIRQLVTASDAEIKQAVDVLLAAFGEDDPFTALTLGGDWSLARPSFESGVRTGLLSGEVHVATLGPEVKDIIGVAVWYGPGHSPGSTEEHRKMGSEIFFSKCPEELKRWWIEYFLPRMERLSNESLGPGFKEAQWYLLLLGVAPEHHHKGVAKAMMKVVEERAKADSVSIVLETPREANLRIYERMGFEKKGQMEVESPQYGQISIYQMLKKLAV